MSVEHLSVVLHHSRARGTAKVVLLGIANHAGDGGSWPTVRTLARYANVHPRKVQEHLSALEQLGEVARHVQAGGNANVERYDRPNLYEVLVACPEGCAGGPNHKPRAGYQRLEDGTYPPVAPVDNAPATPLPKTAPPAETGTGSPAGNGTQTIPSTTVPNVSSQLQTAREDVGGVRPLDNRRCRTCSAPDERACLRRQLRLSSSDRHPFNPAPMPAPHPGAATAGEVEDQHDTDRTDRKATGSAGGSSPSASGAADDNERPTDVGGSPQTGQDNSSNDDGAQRPEEV